MADTAPALKTLFKDIKREFLREILKRCSVKTELIDWNITNQTYEDDVFNVLVDLAKSSKVSDKKNFAAVCTTLFDINAVCNDQRRGRYVIDTLKASGRIGEALQEWGSSRPTIHWIISWVYLKMPTLWEKLRKTAIIKQAIGLGGQKKYIKKPASDEPSQLQANAFCKEFLDYMEREHTLISFLHPDREDLGNYVRYVFHVNPFPKNVEQFDEKGNFGLNLDRNAEGFTIIHYKDKVPYIRIKCGFSSSQTKRIAELFVKHMLSSEIIDKPAEEYPIKSFNSKYDKDFHLTIKSPRIAEARVSGASLQITDPESGVVDELTHRCKTGEIFPRLVESCAKFPIPWREPIAWEFSIGIFKDEIHVEQKEFKGMESRKPDRPVQYYTVRVTAKNLSLPCNDEIHKELILKLLADNGIKNVFKKEILAREYRK